MHFETIIGLEVHAQLKTQSKLFSGSATLTGAPPNAQTSFIDAGLPGVLPCLNKEALELGIRFGLCIGAVIQEYTYFERKNYLYPDLPKGYQISQFKQPLLINGALTISADNGEKTIHIARAHLEEDAGKSFHDPKGEHSFIDLNRAGTPLLEIVTSPCLHSAKEAIAYLKQLHELLRFINVCDGNMEEGSFRVDVNVSLKPTGSPTLGTRCEIKNMNSFRFIEKAIQYEQARQQDLLESGQTITQETRGFLPQENRTYSLRNKEQEQDYRYFPDPDLLPIYIEPQWIKDIQSTLSPLPIQIRTQLRDAGIANEDIDFLMSTPACYRFFKALSSAPKLTLKTIINWLKGPYIALLNEQSGSFEAPPVEVDTLTLLLTHLEAKDITFQQAKHIFAEQPKSVDAVQRLITKLTADKGFDEATMLPLIKEIIATHPEQAAEYRQGKEKLLTFFVGQIMRHTKGKADPILVAKMFDEVLKS